MQRTEKSAASEGTMGTSAFALSKQIRRRERSVREVVEETLVRMEAQEGEIHAFLDIEAEQALQKAEEVQEKLDAGETLSSLAGVPIAVKDNICIRGWKTTCASRILEGFRPPYTATAVERLKEAGVIPIGKTNMDEFAMGSTTETSYYGITRNPRRLACVPGGSSGGSCAAVASGEVLLALGSDTGGSIRQPASHCGVTGMKPTYGTVSRYGLIAYGSSLDQIGPVAGSVSECAALLELMAGHDPKDSTSLRRTDTHFTDALIPEVRRMRIGIAEEFLSDDLQPEIRKTLEKTAALLTEKGAQVECFKAGFLEYVVPTYYILACAEASSNLERFDGVKYGFRRDGEDLHEMYKRTRTEGFGSEVKKRIMLGSFVLSTGYYDAYYKKALQVQKLIRKAYREIFKTYDILLSPAAPETAPEIGTSLKDPMKMYMSDIYTVPVNLAGLPALTLPCGQDRKGMPIGLQFIGGSGMDAKVIQAAYACECSLAGEKIANTDRGGVQL